MNDEFEENLDVNERIACDVCTIAGFLYEEAVLFKHSKYGSFDFMYHRKRVAKYLKDVLDLIEDIDS